MYLVSEFMRRGSKNIIFAENLQQSTQYKFDQKSIFFADKKIMIILPQYFLYGICFFEVGVIYSSHFVLRIIIYCVCSKY